VRGLVLFLEDGGAPVGDGDRTDLDLTFTERVTVLPS
jgi:hypothetical protein